MPRTHLAATISAALLLATTPTIAHADTPDTCTTSVNGMPIIPLDATDEWTVDGITFWTAPGEATTLLHDFTAWFAATIEPLNTPTSADTGDDWSWAASKPINGPGTPCSNHGSGAAVDLNAEQHPLGQWYTFTPTQMVAIRAKLLEYGGKLQWGGNWTDPRDEMHFEYVPDGTPTASFDWVDEIVPGASTSSASSVMSSQGSALSPASSLLSHR